MGSEDAKDPFKGVDWKAVGGDMQQNPSAQPALKKRLPKRVRQIPDYYFLPRWPLRSVMFFCTSSVAAGIAAGMLLESWIQNKVQVTKEVEGIDHVLGVALLHNIIRSMLSVTLLPDLVHGLIFCCFGHARGLLVQVERTKDTVTRVHAGKVAPEIHQKIIPLIGVGHDQDHHFHYALPYASSPLLSPSLAHAPPFRSVLCDILQNSEPSKQLQHQTLKPVMTSASSIRKYTEHNSENTSCWSITS
ncbi:hypothetical protein CR513_42480, partial [Mucuna pruriens]